MKQFSSARSFQLHRRIKICGIHWAVLAYYYFIIVVVGGGGSSSSNVRSWVVSSAIVVCCLLVLSRVIHSFLSLVPHLADSRF